MMLQRLLALSAVAALTACAATSSPTDLSDADVAAIRALQAKFIAICQTSEWNELPPFFTSDAILIHAHEPAVKGIEAIRDHYRNLKLRAIRVNAEPVIISGYGDLAYLRGKDDGVFQVGNEQPVSGAGIFIWILRKQGDGAWKIAESVSVPVTAGPAVR